MRAVNVWNEWREENPELLHPDLSEADLSWAHLFDADLSGANLHGANLRLAVPPPAEGGKTSVPKFKPFDFEE